MADIFAKRIWQPYICQPNELKREIRKKTGGQQRAKPLPPRIATASALFSAWLFLVCHYHPVCDMDFKSGKKMKCINIFVIKEFRLRPTLKNAVR